MSLLKSFIVSVRTCTASCRCMSVLETALTDKLETMSVVLLVGGSGMVNFAACRARSACVAISSASFKVLTPLSWHLIWSS